MFEREILYTCISLVYKQKVYLQGVCVCVCVCGGGGGGWCVCETLSPSPRLPHHKKDTPDKLGLVTITIPGMKEMIL